MNLIGCNFIIYFIFHFTYYLTRFGLIIRFYSFLVFDIYFKEQNENMIIGINLTEKGYKPQLIRGALLAKGKLVPILVNCGRGQRTQSLGQKGEPPHSGRGTTRYEIEIAEEMQQLQLSFWMFSFHAFEQYFSCACQGQLREL